MSAVTMGRRAETAGPPELSASRRNVAFAVIASGMLLAALDGTIVATALPTIVGELGGAEHLSWVVTAYMLTQTIATALGGKLGDLFGRKAVFITAVVIFVAGSALAGASTSMTWLIASRAIQGLGGGGLTVTATAMIADIIPIRERGKYQGAMGAVFGVATVVGPFLGGLFTDHLSWRWVFYVNVPIAAVVLVAAVRVLPTVKAQTRPVIDYLGIAAISAASTMLILATTWGGTQYDWGSPTILGLFAGGAVALLLFVLIEARAVSPLIPLRLFRGNVFALSCILSFVVGFALMGTMTYLPTYLQYCLGVSATESGIRTFPMVVGLLVASVFAGSMVGRTGKYKVFPIVGGTVMAVGSFLLSRLDETSTVWQTSLAMVVLGVGIGLAMQILVLIVQNTVDYADLGVATSAVSFFRTMGSTFGAAVMGSVYTSALSEHLPPALATAGVPASAVATPAALDALSATQQSVIRHAFAESFQTVFLTAVPLALVAMVLACFLRQVPLRGLVSKDAGDVGRGFGMPDSRTSAGQLEAQLVNVVRQRQDNGILRRVLRLDDTPEPAIARVWAVAEVAVHRLRHDTDVTPAVIAREHRLPVAVLRPALASALERDLIAGTDEGLTLTPAGQTAFLRLAATVRTGLVAEIEDEYDRSLSAPEREEVGRIAWDVVVHGQVLGQYVGRHRHGDGYAIAAIPGQP
ncbi:MAG TPA: MDR family MFS transporter [Lapillicoccus sp.]|uniref:MDR family MFS transporter n=1 Tax=Lapillicoccus sp. TaxID=1909287 RepID=UPI002F95C51C